MGGRLKVVCFFKAAAMWPTSIELKELTPADQARIGALVKKAVS